MKLSVIFPPVTDPTIPILGPLAVRTVWRNLGHDADFIDLNLRFHEWFLSRIDPAVRQPAHIVAEKRLLESVTQNRWRDAVRIIRGKGGLRALDLENAFATLMATYRARSHAYLPWRVSMTNLHAPADSAMPDTLLTAASDPESPLREFSQAQAAQLLADKYSVIGISVCFESQVIPALHLLRFLRELRRNEQYPLLIVGGALINAWANRLARFPQIVSAADLFSRGDAESSLPAVAGYLQGRNDLTAVPGAIIVRDQQAISIPVRAPDVRTHAHLVDMTDLPTGYWFPRRTLPVRWGSGCYWARCAFCGVHASATVGPKARCVHPNMDAVVRQIRHIRAQGVERVAFASESLHPANLMELERRLHEERLEIEFSCFVRPDSASMDHLASVLRRAGCDQVALGFESVSDRVLALMNKGVSRDSFVPGLERFRKAGIRVLGLFMIGFPGETESEAMETIRFIEENYELMHYAPVSLFAVHTRSPVFNDPARFGCQIPKDAGLSIFVPHYTERGMAVSRAREIYALARQKVSTTTLSEWQSTA